MERGVLITRVHFASPAHRAGLKKGDLIVAFDGHPYQDPLDVAFFDAQASFDVTIVRDGKQVVRHVEKGERALGIEYTEDEMKLMHCANKCIFCFVDQCPKGMRQTLYVKDDDYRTSFACGSYVTLSNLKEEDVSRIIRMGLSPLYISVHAFDKETKKLLCANPHSADLFDYLVQFEAHGIAMHTQIVMAEGINSGAVLEETLNELYKLTPAVRSVAVVPVGLTAHRDGLYPLKPVSAACAKETIALVESFSERAYRELGVHWAWCSDEMYLLAGQSIPDDDYYDDYVQIENGVGMVRTFLQEAEEGLSLGLPIHGAYTLVTGKSFAPILSELAKRISADCPISLDVAEVSNDWFGHTITVAGLLTGRDIVNHLKRSGYHRDVVIPHTVLKEFENVLLDGMSVADIEKELDCKIHISCSGKSLIYILAGKDEEYYE